MTAFATVLCAMAVLATVVAGRNRVTIPGCSNVGQERVIQGTEDYDAYELEIADCQINKVNISQYVLPNIKWVKIDNNKIDDWEFVENFYHTWNKLDTVTIFRQNNIVDAPNTLLQGLGVRYLEVFYCSLREVPKFVLQLSSLELLQLKFNSITALADPEMFSALVNLYDFEIPHNQIQYIHADVFKSLTNLKYICLDYNRIQYLDEKIFETLNKLEHLNLSNNQIQYLPPNIFNGCANLEELDLSNNRLTDLPANFITGLNSLKIFNIDENPWQCACLREMQTEVMIMGKKWESTTSCIQTDFAAHCYRHDEYLRLFDSRDRLGKLVTYYGN